MYIMIFMIYLKLQPLNDSFYRGVNNQTLRLNRCNFSGWCVMGFMVTVSDGVL